jgi:hypothetical protein
MLEPPPRIIAEFNDYPGLIAGIRERVNELNVPLELLDEIAGLPTRYVSKILGPAQVRRFSMQSLAPLLGALGIRCAFLEDPETIARFGSRLRRRMHNSASLAVVHPPNRPKAFYQKMGRVGGPRSRLNMSKRKASQLGRKAAYARWSRATDGL